MWPPENLEMDAPEVRRIEDPQQMMAQIFECVEQKDAKGLKTYILEHKLKEESIFWDLILKIGDSVKSENFEYHPNFFEVCNRCLLYLAKIGNPKEGLLAFLQQMDTFNLDDTKYKCFLDFVQTVLKRIPSKLFHSLDIALETVSAHLEGLTLPENLQLEGPEIKLFHLDDKVVRINDVLNSYLDFLAPLVKVSAHSSPISTDAAAKETLVLKKHLVQLFDHPLCYLILTHNSDDKFKSESRQSAEKAMSLLAQVETDFHRFIKNSKTSENSSQSKEFNERDDQTHTETDDTQKKESLSEQDMATDIVDIWNFKINISPHCRACISYLIHTEFLGIDKFPSVYRHDYMLEFNLGILSLLLQNTNYVVNYKGLLLCKCLTERVCKSFIPTDNLDNPGYITVLNDLINVMVKCPVRDHRTLATQVFPSLIARFEAPGRYRIYQNILSSCTHSGLKGYLITLLKNDVSEYLKLPQKHSTTSREMGHQHVRITIASVDLPEKCFSGNSLHRLLKLVLYLPEGERTDILENSDQITSALNFLRFLVLADSSKSNRTGLWGFIDTIKKDFIDPLRLGLDLSQAHYKLERDNIAQGKMPAGSAPELSVSVDGATLPAAEKEQKLDLLDRALNTHQMMISLLCRLLELMEQQSFA